MIIKSMSRKDGSYRSFQQLYDYITRDDGCDQRFNFTHNFFADDRESILDEFTRNARFVPQRENGNYLYHEILSFTRSTQLSQQQQLEIMRKVSQRYLKDRARGCLGFGGAHTDKDNQLHVHLIISANQIDQAKKHSLSKSVYDQIKRGIEAHVLQQYPEMEQENLINQTNEEKKIKREQSRENKPNRTQQRNEFAQQVEEIMSQAHSDKEFQELLHIHGIEFKYKPANITLTNPVTGLSHRIKTLGLQDVYEQIIKREQQAQKEQEASQNQANQSSRKKDK